MSATGQMFEQQENEIIKLRKQLHAYQHTVNRIDDFFEYANDSIGDRQYVHELLADLTEKLTQIK